jgi:3D (Asp-Asp-Asp) domain-containing protein
MTHRGTAKGIVTRTNVARVIVALCLAAAYLKTGAVQPPTASTAAPSGPLRHPPVVVYSEITLAPLVVRAERIVHHIRGPFDRAPIGKGIHVSLTQYCLQGMTRRDNYVRPGIVAADPRVFPLARYVEVFIGKQHLGRFLVDDTGAKVKGATLDIWNPSCAEARKFGRQRGIATLVGVKQTK